MTKISLDLTTIIRARLDRLIGIFPGPVFKQPTLGNLNKEVFKNQIIKEYFTAPISTASKQAVWLYQLTSITSGLNSRSLVYKIINEAKNICGYHIFLVDNSFINRYGSSLASENVTFLVLDHIKNQSSIERLFAAADFMVVINPFSYKTEFLHVASYYKVIPIISSIGIGSDYIKDSQNGFLLIKNDLKSYKKTIARALNMYDSPVFSTMSPPNFPNWVSTAEKHLEIYDKAYQINQHNRAIL